MGIEQTIPRIPAPDGKLALPDREGVPPANEEAIVAALAGHRPPEWVRCWEALRKFYNAVAEHPAARAHLALSSLSADDLWGGRGGQLPWLAGDELSPHRIVRSIERELGGEVESETPRVWRGVYGLSVADEIVWHERVLQAFRSVNTERDKVAWRHHGLMRSMVVRFAHRHGNCRHEDALRSAAGLGMARAIDRFDVLRGARFSTYACHVMANELLRIERLIARQRAVVRLLDLSDTGIEERGRAEAMQKIVNDVLSGRERVMLREHYLSPEPVTCKAIGETFGVRRERARQIKESALSKLRQYLEDENSPELHAGCASRPIVRLDERNWPRGWSKSVHYSEEE